MRLRMLATILVVFSVLVGESSLANDRTSFCGFEPPKRLLEGVMMRFTPRIVDINGDGRLDVVATQRKAENALHVLVQNDRGEFMRVRQTWPTPKYGPLAVGDIDGDGRIDVVVATHFREIWTFLNDGAGGFRYRSFETPAGFAGAELVDFDGDGELDLAVLADRPARVTVYKMDPAVGWRVFRAADALRVGRDLAAGDLDGDGRPDLVGAGGNRGAVAFLQDADGRLKQLDAKFPSKNGIFQSVRLGDVNGDGRLDIALSGGAGEEGEGAGPSVFLADGEGGWRETSTGLKTMRFSTRGLELVDVDHDGDLDLVAGGNVSGELGAETSGLFLFEGDGHGNWSLRTDSGLPASGLAETRGIASADMNGDGLVDLVTTNAFVEDPSGGYLLVWHQRACRSQ